LYYPPLFKVTAEPGSFRTSTYERPTSIALSADAPAASADEQNAYAPSQMNVAQQLNAGPSQTATQALVDKYRARSEAGKAAGTAPIRISFPAVGPSLFLVSELTAENQGPAVELSYQKDKKGGPR